MINTITKKDRLPDYQYILDNLPDGCTHVELDCFKSDSKLNYHNCYRFNGISWYQMSYNGILSFPRWKMVDINKVKKSFGLIMAIDSVKIMARQFPRNEITKCS